MPHWFIPVFIALAVLSFLMTPPTFLANRFVASFAVHPRLNSGDAIYVNGQELKGDKKEEFIRRWNEARFQYRVYNNFDDNDTAPVRVFVDKPRRRRNFLLFSDGRYIDVIKQIPKRKTVFYRLRGEALHDFLTGSVEESSTLVHS